MQIAMIGLGGMGANMVRRLMAGGHQCVVYDIHSDAVQESVPRALSAPRRLPIWRPSSPNRGPCG